MMMATCRPIGWKKPPGELKGSEKEEFPPPRDDGNRMFGGTLDLENNMGATFPRRAEPQNRGTILHYFANMDCLRKGNVKEKTGSKRRREDDDGDVLPELRMKFAKTFIYLFRLNLGAKSVTTNNPKNRKKKSRKAEVCLESPSMY